MTAMLDAAIAYRDNHHWVPLRLIGKSPDVMGSGWQKRTLTDPVPEFEAGDNIGILLGAPSDNLVRLDPDFETIKAVIDILFPEPTTIAGRKSSPRSTRLYSCEDTKSKDFNLPNAMKDDQRLPLHDGKRSLKVYQILGNGKQTVVPPSIHPDSGEEIRWVTPGVKPKIIERDELIRRVGIEAFCMAVRQFWPACGTRNETAMALARVLLEALNTRIEDDDERIAIVDELVVAVAMAGGDGEDSRPGKERAAATLEKMRSGEETTGLPRLVELLELPETVIKTFRNWLGLATRIGTMARVGRWRECRANGRPIASLYNARAAIAALGIVCRYDLFHHKITIEYRGTVHEWTGGELDDIALTRMRQFVSEQFGFDPGAINLLDAIKTIAVEHCFDPVVELLDEAQRNWDNKPRLDNWVVTYLGCKDTELNRAIGRKTLVAAIRRVRVPGCKYDIVTVLESPEGRGKSNAIRILAGDENFSDQSVLGKHDKEVQEQLDGIWMHESADLAGMTRAEVEHVKAFASRQVDRARPAYGRVREDRKRRSIEWGTTNNKEYLLSQTGNRRFWPLEVDHIDIEALKRDRLQLLGEAATYEADGEDVVLDNKLWDTALEEQEKRRVTDPWEDILVDMPNDIPVWSKRKDKDDDNNGPDGVQQIIHHYDNRDEQRVSSRDILEYILKIPPVQQKRFDAMRLSDVMRVLGWMRNSNGKVVIEGVQVRGYWRKTPPL